MRLSDEPLFTELFEEAAAFLPEPGSVYFYGESVEDRSKHVAAWKPRAPRVQFVRVIKEESNAVEIELPDGQDPISLKLRSSEDQQHLWGELASTTVYLDVTGLSHHVWAPLLRSALDTKPQVKVVYVEPGSYTFNPFPTEGQIFDLSERITGIRPLPGLATIAPRRISDVVFVPLLGFEGPRLAYLLEQVQPPNDRIIPIVGLPGFRAEYPFHTYAGNKRPLLEAGAWRRVRYAIANCPFDVFYALDRIAAEFPESLIKIAPIGTKPHAVGAVLFKLVSDRTVELVYDHPIRKAGRTEASDRLLVYHVSALGSRTR